MENTYGIGIANRYELFYDQDDVVDFETVITKKKKSKEPATAQQTPAPASAIQQKSAAEKENKQVKKETGPQKATSDQPRRGIKEQSNNSNKDSAAPRKDGGESRVPFFGKFFTSSSCHDERVCVREENCHELRKLSTNFMLGKVENVISSLCEFCQ